MKVGTDAVSLGAWLDMPDFDNINALEIGTGSGVISLMMAQRLEESGLPFHIDAIDIDTPSVEEALYNFGASPWKENLSAKVSTLQQYEPSNDGYELIFSNPPFFVNSLKAPEQRRSNARHSTELTHQELIEHSIRLLKTGGHLGVILPFAEGEDFIKAARFTQKLQIKKACKLYTTLRKEPKRLMLDFVLSDCLTLENSNTQDLVINSPEYIVLARPFYLHLL